MQNLCSTEEQPQQLYKTNFEKSDAKLPRCDKVKVMKKECEQK